MTRQWTTAHSLHLVRRLLGYHECGEINGHQWVMDSEHTFRLPDFPANDAETRKAGDAWVWAAPGSRHIEFGIDVEARRRWVRLRDRLDGAFPLLDEGATWTEALAWALWRAEQ
jgi:hypothetical protein